MFFNSGLYTDESPGLKVDPVVVLVLSLGFIFSVVALHSTYTPPIVACVADKSLSLDPKYANSYISHCQAHSKVLIIGNLAFQGSRSFCLAGEPIEWCRLCQSTEADCNAQWAKGHSTHGCGGGNWKRPQKLPAITGKEVELCTTIIY